MKDRSLWTVLAETIFPTKCLICNKEGENWLCRKCQKEKLKYLSSSSCPFCNQVTNNNQVCNHCQKSHGLSGLISSCQFNDTIKKLIYQYKYYHNKDISNLLTKMLINKIKNHQIIKAKPMIISTPIHPLNRLKRGFNQSRPVAKKIAKSLDLEYQDKLIKKIKITKSQTKLNRQERKQNLANAFKLDRAINIKNKTILIVDDVFTTGATLDELAKTIKKGKSKQVWGAVIAKR